jgi:septal ring factor EnvC (AmiA/AmiB activator)
VTFHYFLQVAEILQIPSWLVVVTLSVVTGLLGFAWRLAEKANSSADKILEATKKLESLESRVAMITALEKQLALVEQNLDHFKATMSELAAEIKSLRESRHKAASEMLKMETEQTRLSREIDRLSDKR